MMQQQSTRTEDFSSRLSSELADARLKQVNLAVRCGVSESRVSEWLKGKSRPQPRTLAAIATTLGVRPEWLMKGDEPKWSEASQKAGERIMQGLAIPPAHPNIERDIPNTLREAELAAKFRIIATALNDIADMFDSSQQSQTQE